MLCTIMSSAAVPVPGVPAPTTTLLVNVANATVAAAAEREATADLYLVKYHADWCPKCISLVSPWDAAKAQLATEDANILFVRLDRTDEAKGRQSALLSAELGLSDQWNTYSRRNGSMILFDSEGKVVREFKAGTAASDIISAVRSAG